MGELLRLGGALATTAAAADPEDTLIADLIPVQLVTAACYDCGASFCVPFGATALRQHARMVHGVRSEALAGVHGTSCLHCLVEFWQLSRFVQHLKGVPVCLFKTRANVAAIEAPALEALRVADRDQTRTARKGIRMSRLPAVRLAGPRPEWAS